MHTRQSGRERCMHACMRKLALSSSCTLIRFSRLFFGLPIAVLSADFSQYACAVQFCWLFRSFNADWWYWDKWQWDPRTRTQTRMTNAMCNMYKMSIVHRAPRMPIRRHCIISSLSKINDLQIVLFRMGVRSHTHTHWATALPSSPSSDELIYVYKALLCSHLLVIQSPKIVHKTRPTKIPTHHGLWAIQFNGREMTRCVFVYVARSLKG